LHPEHVLDTKNDQKMARKELKSGKMGTEKVAGDLGDCSALKKDNYWINEVDALFMEVLKNPRLRNFVCVNTNGAEVLCDISRYLAYIMTAEEVSERLRMPLSEVTPQCFDIVHEEQAKELYGKLVAMNGLEHIANSKIPEPPTYTNGWK
uniref:ATP-dependent DNA helicase n=1 Tax=Gongylonema pulchrum TaxID=637853 RepID=A0A183DXS5_9BILA